MDRGSRLVHLKADRLSLLEWKKHSPESPNLYANSSFKRIRRVSQSVEPRHEAATKGQCRQIPRDLLRWGGAKLKRCWVTSTMCGALDPLLNQVQRLICSKRLVFSPIVDEEPFDLGAELSVHPGLELSKLLERFILPSDGICPRAKRIIASQGDHTWSSCTGVPLLMPLTDMHAGRCGIAAAVVAKKCFIVSTIFNWRTTPLTSECGISVPHYAIAGPEVIVIEESGYPNNEFRVRPMLRDLEETLKVRDHGSPSMAIFGLDIKIRRIQKSLAGLRISYNTARPGILGRLAHCRGTFRYPTTRPR
ncbi:hypothetical protein PCH_Pc17g00350 [Penicillium rubens Wisconsin 54-1255]|uniref:Uncharacterized protein n=1 Tax=Penicillium rubens (strain ATCC 28089 / DSM 1075 / NRRL 1951 / Wisconsin 54-1255) TaxID=500485 RepID=B6HAW7_PENRW|nr:hypothetical protein PCH_Pc17g00350 [Penicillium rubens Wisconsin 54-1255]